jgi:DNA-binding NtrC family response regulator
MTRAAILICDDEKGVQTSLQGILEDAGFNPQAVSSGEDTSLLFSWTSGCRESTASKH